MKIKNFYLNIDDEKIKFFSIPIDDDNSIAENLVHKDYVLSNNPQILDITHLNYVPAKLSVWNGSEFIAPEGQEHRPACGDACVNGCVSFAFLKDNTYYGMNGYCVGIGHNDMLIAALSSSPTITSEVGELV
jgi:hypothetical protein